MNSRLAGGVLATLAALFNGTVGVISVNLFTAGLSAQAVAFYKCLLALAVLGAVLLVSGQWPAVIRYLQAKWRHAAVCAFFGFFMLYNFETAAYQYVNVAVVVFCLFGTSTVTTFIFSAVLEKRGLRAADVFSVGVSLLGLSLIFLDVGSIGVGSYAGIGYGVLSGIGYGVFLVLSKRFELGGGLVAVFALMLFGVAYLAVPFALAGLSVPAADSLPVLLLLAVLPTIGGFWCTVKALTLLNSQSVQLIELTEPVFAMVIGFMVLGQVTTLLQAFGGGLILLAIAVHEWLQRRAAQVTG
ncbi:EamA family transporter [Aliamphritea spongicola]|uniref:EamA family transporter n=1 Tax=Aliamphritea spongicola TaxID=707589 RepID=UPI00196B52E0|nr:DMT family transporter [Aliamphritea spongicola]